MTKFEYLVKDIGPGDLASDKVQSLLDDLGDSGWELVSVYERQNSYQRHVLRRQKQGRRSVNA